MAFSFMGPESPRPLSVISESYQHRLILPRLPVSDSFNFGTDYEKNMHGIIHKYMDLETTDRLCYVGDMKGSFAEGIVQRFCLLEPMLTVIPGHYSYVETDTNKVLPVRIAHVGAEEFFRQQDRLKPEKRHKFDKIILKDAIRYFQTPQETYQNIMSCLSKNGKLLIIHRPSNLNTLPIFKDAKQRLEDNEIPYMDLINDLKSCDFDVQWEVECLPVLMSKRKWFSLLHSKFPPQMEIMSDFEVTTGVRELSEGILKYEGDLVEFDDRLLFITVSAPNVKTRGPLQVRRHGAPGLVPYPTASNKNYAMEITAEIQELIKDRKPDIVKESRRNCLAWS